MTIWSVIAFCFSLLLLLPLFFFEFLFNFVAEFSIIPTDASTLPAELQRLLNTVRELDERSQCNCFLEFLFYISFVAVYSSAHFYLSFKIFFLCRNQEVLFLSLIKCFILCSSLHVN